MRYTPYQGSEWKDDKRVYLEIRPYVNKFERWQKGQCWVKPFCHIILFQILRYAHVKFVLRKVWDLDLLSHDRDTYEDEKSKKIFFEKLWYTLLS